MNDRRHTIRIDSREQQRAATERQRLRAFTTPEECGGLGLSEAAAERLIAILETHPGD